jgi:hypothetical protein
MPRLVPVAKNCSRPLCPNPLIATETSVTYVVTTPQSGDPPATRIHSPHRSVPGAMLTSRHHPSSIKMQSERLTSETRRGCAEAGRRAMRARGRPPAIRLRNAAPAGPTVLSAPPSTPKASGVRTFNLGPSLVGSLDHVEEVLAGRRRRTPLILSTPTPLASRTQQVRPGAFGGSRAAGTGHERSSNRLASVALLHRGSSASPRTRSCSASPSLSGGPAGREAVAPPGQRGMPMPGTTHGEILESLLADRQASKAVRCRMPTWQPWPSSTASRCSTDGDFCEVRHLRWDQPAAAVTTIQCFFEDKKWWPACGDEL